MHHLEAVPELYSKPLDLHDLWHFYQIQNLVFSVPLFTVTSEYNPTFLNASTSPVTNPTSGEP